MEMLTFMFWMFLAGMAVLAVIFVGICLYVIVPAWLREGGGIPDWVLIMAAFIFGTPIAALFVYVLLQSRKERQTVV